VIAPRVSGRDDRTPNWSLVYGAGIVIAEATLVAVDVRLGATLHAALLIALAAHVAFGRMPKDPQLPVLALLPLTRLVSLVMPTDTFDPELWYALIGGPVLAAAILTSRAISLPASRLGLRWPVQLLPQVLIALGGLALGFLLARGDTDLGLRGTPTPAEAVVLIVVFVVPLEELLFRGLLQYTAGIRGPGLAIGVPNVLYAAMYFGAGTEVALLMGGIGTLFSVAVARTGLLWGVLAAHVLMRLVIQFAG
jgi:membrane protease YdiL (CAAX protease family)